MKIKSWEDVDFALGAIAESRKIVAEAKGKIDEEKSIISDLEARVEAFTREHEDELQERSKSLPHGRVWLRQATKLVARSWGKVLERLIELKVRGAIRTKEEVDKEVLSLFPDENLEKIGVRRKTEDVFGYEAS